VEVGGGGDGGEALALGLGVEGRRGQKCAQVAAVGQHRLERLQVGVDGRNLIVVLRQIEQGLRVTRAHIRSLGFIRQVETRQLRLSHRQRTPRGG
jgi:hypothetical protein